MRLDWDDLRYFLAVAREGTVSGAARRLAVDHATIIRRVDALERALSAKLFERSLKGYGLTQPGERLLESARRMDSEAERVQSEVGTPGDVAGSVRISSLEGFGNFFLAPRLPTFKRAYPRLRVELVTIQQIVALSRREADIAITVNPPAVTRFEQRPLVDYSLFVYGAIEYLAGNKPIEHREDLADHPFSGYIDDLVFTRGLDYLGEVLPGLKPSLQSSSLHAQMEFACAGHGLCVLPSFIARRRPELVRILPEEIALKRTYWLITPNNEDSSLGVAQTSRFIAEAVDSARDLFA